jgi:UDP-glucoronosyl and UDP-glucosyl transferase
MTTPAVAFFAMRQEGHFESLLPLVSGLAHRGIEAHVFTDREFQARVEGAGGRFVDLFDGRPVEAVDDESLPAPCRYVTYAGRHAAEIAAELDPIDPGLIVHDAHAVVGRAVAVARGIPHVSVCPAHNVNPNRLQGLVDTLPVVSISPGCERAVEALRRGYQLDASPFSFASWLSPFLNIYGEPPAYLNEGERAALEPVAFSGCLPSIEGIEAARNSARPRYFDGHESGIKVYVSFGTVVWRYFPAEALAAARALSESLGTNSKVSVVISLGGAEPGPAAVASLERPNVRVFPYVDQWGILEEVDAFVTHNGLKSTHEAIYSRVPMISYPFFWDQPDLAETCRRFGVAIPLTGSRLAQVTGADVSAALAGLAEAGDSIRASLERTREWELRLIEGRDSVLDRIIDLIPG